ncbi:MAG: hypothetical protein NTX29_11740 [Actinobacteria bacterium]|nr:hypothetical protein [Actinomycetota bacterium]
MNMPHESCQWRAVASAESAHRLEVVFILGVDPEAIVDAERPRQAQGAPDFVFPSALFLRLLMSTTVARWVFIRSAMLRLLSREACADVIAALTVE